MNLDLRKTVALVALLNLAFFAVEFGVAQKIGSVSLFADSVDFLEDASINLLIFVALGWSVQNRARLGTALVAIILIPGAATLWTAWSNFLDPVTPNPFLMTVTGTGALLVNLSCAALLTRFRAHSGSLTKAAFLSARNDALANIGIICAGLLTALLVSAWPDLIIGLAIAAMNADAAKDVFIAARKEAKLAEESTAA